jgi:putative transposase
LRRHGVLNIHSLSVLGEKTGMNFRRFYPPELRKLIYTTNMIESYHRQLRKATKGKSIFPTDGALLKMLYLATMDILRKWTGRVQNWGQILLHLTIYFPERIQVR